MPFIHVRSLPFKRTLDISAIVEGMTEDFAKDTATNLLLVTATWTFLAEGQYAVAGKAARHQPRDSHPILVDLIVPDYHSPERIESMMRSVAASIARRTEVPAENVFVQCQLAGSRRVFDGGEIVRW